MTKREQLEEQYDGTELLFADGYDDAILGICANTNRVIYSKKKCVQILAADMEDDEDVEDGGMTADEKAIEYLDYNAVCAYVGELTPIWCDDMDLVNYPAPREITEVKEYQITTVSDMANAVTPNNIDDFMNDLRRMLLEYMLLVAKYRIVRNINFEDKQNTEIISFPSYKWIDDGLRKITIDLKTKNKNEE